MWWRLLENRIGEKSSTIKVFPKNERNVTRNAMLMVCVRDQMEFGNNHRADN